MKAPSKIQIIGIAGGSGSGKTTFARALADRIGESRCAVLTQDHYYIDQSAQFRGDGENVNFDHPDSLDFPLMALQLEILREGKTIAVPIYDFATHKRQIETTPFEARPIVLVDGTLILSQESIRSRLDRSAFIETTEELRFSRRLSRDVRERGRQPEGVHKQFFRQVKPMHDLFVEPSKIFATEIISGETEFEREIGRWVAALG